MNMGMEELEAAIEKCFFDVLQNSTSKTFLKGAQNARNDLLFIITKNTSVQDKLAMTWDMYQNKIKINALLGQDVKEEKEGYTLLFSLVYTTMITSTQ